MSQRTTCRLVNRVAHILMDDGKVNVMSIEMLGELNDAFDRAASQADAVVLRSGRKGIFSAGFDLKVFAANDPLRSQQMVRAGAELALRLMSFPRPLIGVMEGHAFPMGTFLLLACDLRIGALGPYRIGLNEVVIGITPPRFAIELARSRVHPAWLSRTVTLGEMFDPQDAVTAGLLDCAVPPDEIESRLADALSSFQRIDLIMHGLAKQNLRRQTMAAMREMIDADLTPQAYRSAAERAASVKLPKGFGAY